METPEKTSEPVAANPIQKSAKIDLQGPAARMVISALALLLLLAAVVFGMESKAKSRVNDQIARGVDALSGPASLFILQNSADRTKKFVDSVKSAGEYEEVTLTDGAGRVLASTDSARAKETIPLPSPAPFKARLSTVGEDLKVYRAISIGGDNVIGMLIITMKS